MSQYLNHDYAWPSVCPHCGYRADAATVVLGNGNPKEGDVSLCVRCTQFAIFTLMAPGALRIATVHEIAKIMADPDTQVLQQAMRDVKRKSRNHLPPVTKKA